MFIDSLIKKLPEEIKMTIYGRDYHYNKFHIFINKDLSNWQFNTLNNEKHSSRYISKDHHIHIYISIRDIINDGLRIFISNAKRYGIDKSVYIHISRDDEELEIIIRNALSNLYNYKIIKENNSYVTKYNLGKDFTEKIVYLYVSYTDKNGIEKINSKIEEVN